MGTNLRQFGHLVPALTFGAFRRRAVLREGGTAVFAGLSHHIDNEIDPFGGNQNPMRAAVSGLSSRFAPRFLPLRMNAFPRSWSIGGWGLGGIGGVLLPPGQLMFEIRDLFVAIDDLPFPVGDFLLKFTGSLFKVGEILLVPICLAPKLFVLSAELLDFPAKLLEKRCRLSRAPAERNSWKSWSRFCDSGRNHPPYSGKNREKCPAKSFGPPELLQYNSGSCVAI
jgi:hypothetical protein